MADHEPVTQNSSRAASGQNMEEKDDGHRASGPVETAEAHDPPCPDAPCQDDQGNWYPPADADVVDESSMDSFPCSDPPSHMSQPATPSVRPTEANQAKPPSKPR
jgi:hypothetical protein